MTTDPEDLTDAQSEELSRDLHQLIIELQVTLTALTEGSKPVDLGEPIGRLSRMEAIQQQKMAAANRVRAKIRLEQAQAALRLLSDVDYGYCRRCDDPIGYRRLKARPETPFCIVCQSELES